jgi:hypothetical protein
MLPSPTVRKDLVAHDDLFVRNNLLVQDELMVWMGFINPGMLSRRNLVLFLYCIEHLPTSAPIVEIGSFAGLSLNHLIHFLRKTGKPNKVFSVDSWYFEGYRPGGLIGDIVSFDACRAHVIETFRRNVMLFSGDRLPHHIEISSDDFFVAWDAGHQQLDFFGNRAELGGPISFAYIDGNHTYEQSWKDFENVDHHLVTGGFIVFDDSSDGSEWGSNRTARKAVDLGRYEVIAKNPNYCLRKR